MKQRRLLFSTWLLEKWCLQEKNHVAYFFLSYQPIIAYYYDYYMGPCFSYLTLLFIIMITAAFISHTLLIINYRTPLLATKCYCSSSIWLVSHKLESAYRHKVYNMYLVWSIHSLKLQHWWMDEDYYYYYYDYYYVVWHQTFNM